MQRSDNLEKNRHPGPGRPRIWEEYLSSFKINYLKYKQAMKSVAKMTQNPLLMHLWHFYYNSISPVQNKGWASDD